MCRTQQQQLRIKEHYPKTSNISCNYRLRVTCNSMLCECGLDENGKKRTDKTKQEERKKKKTSTRTHKITPKCRSLNSFFFQTRINA